MNASVTRAVLAIPHASCGAVGLADPSAVSPRQPQPNQEFYKGHRGVQTGVAMQRGWRLVLAQIVLMGTLACNGSKTDTATSAHVGSGETCDLTPIANTQKLRACAAGESSASGPGIPFDMPGPVETAMPVSAEEQAAIDAANALEAQRNALVPTPPIPTQDPPHSGGAHRIHRIHLAIVVRSALIGIC